MDVFEGTPEMVMVVENRTSKVECVKQCPLKKRKHHEINKERK